MIPSIALICKTFGLQFLEFEKEMPTTKIAAEVLKCDESSVIKTCIVKAKSFAAVILQGTDRIDSQKLQNLIGRFSFAKPDEVLAVTGYIAGGVPPFGFCGAINRVIIDQKVFSHREVYGGGGTKNTLVKTTPQLIKTINEPKIEVTISDVS